MKETLKHLKHNVLAAIVIMAPVTAFNVAITTGKLNLDDSQLQANKSAENVLENEPEADQTVHLPVGYKFQDLRTSEGNVVVITRASESDEDAETMYLTVIRHKNGTVDRSYDIRLVEIDNSTDASVLE